MTFHRFFCLSLPIIAWVPLFAEAGVKVLPVLNRPIADCSGLSGFPLTVDLDAAFGTEAIDDNVVRFTSQFSDSGIPVMLDMALFSNRTPVTRANFLKYVTDGDYVDSFLHRSVPGFVIQGGASRVVNNSIESVPTDPPIVNEFGVSNTLGTVSMAKQGGNPDSATSQWFVSLGENSDILDPQNGGFTVFGRLTKATLSNAQVFGNPSVFPVFDYGGIYTELPLWYEHVPGNLLIEEFILFPSVSLVPISDGQAGEDTTLDYSVVSNGNPAVVTVAIVAGGKLELSPVAGQTGTSVLTVRATDSVGNAVDDTFVLTVNDTYATWASRNEFSGEQSGGLQNPDGDGLNNLLEYAFLENPAVPSQGPLPIVGKTGVSPSDEFITLTFPVRKFTAGLTYVVEGSDALGGSWAEVWKSADGFGHSQVLEAIDLADRTVVKIQDHVAIGAQLKRFLRVRIVQE